jgi:hypothetical protein
MARVSKINTQGKTQVTCEAALPSNTIQVDNSNTIQMDNSNTIQMDNSHITKIANRARVPRTISRLKLMVQNTNPPEITFAIYVF